MAGSTAEFHAQRLPPQREEDVRSRIFRGAKVVVDATDGSDLEAVLDLAGGHVLFLTYDSPFDEGLHLIYLDGADVLRDEARIGFLYPGGVGLLRDVRALDDACAEFEFYGRWRLRVDRRGRIPLSPAPPGVHRAGRTWPRRRHLWFERIAP